MPVIAVSPSAVVKSHPRNTIIIIIMKHNAIETAGTWHEMAIELTQEIGRRITTITEDTRETTFLFQRLSMALQRGNAVSFHNTMVTSPTRSSAFTGVPERIVFKMATLTYRALHGSAPPYLSSSFTCVADMPTDAGSGPPQLNSLTFRPVVGQLSVVVPFLLLAQRCGMACQAMLRRPRCCRCSRTG